MNSAKKNLAYENNIFSELLTLLRPTLIILCIVEIMSCSKQDVLNENDVASKDSSALQTAYLEKLKSNLQDSLNVSDFAAVDFNKVYRSNDIQSNKYFVRLYFKGKTNYDDFILMKTNSGGNILTAKIVHVKKDQQIKNADDITVTTSSLNRRNQAVLTNAVQNYKADSSKPSRVRSSGNVSSLLATTNPDDVVETGYDDDWAYYWFLFEDILGGPGAGGGGVNIYGASQPPNINHGGGGGYPIVPDATIAISYENSSLPALDITKYIKCFSSIPSQGAFFTITIYSDLPVNTNPNTLFDWSTGACGHSFLQLTKTNGINRVQQNIGFYPQSGWKSVANSAVASKIVDNGGHEYNASLTISVDATHFQNALNRIAQEASDKYDIDDFNCTDFALSIFDAAAPLALGIPQKHIPNGTVGTLSNTPQGLYLKLSSLVTSGGYPGGRISIASTDPGFAGYSHGPCN